MPSPKSREYGFYYGHPQNRFWRVVADVLNQSMPQTNEEKIHFLLQNKIALWDVLKSCYIDGADDSSIRNPVVNDISSIVKHTHIKTIFTTGLKATQIYKKYIEKQTKIESIYLPSTSPANCRHYSYENLVEKYSVIKSHTISKV